MKDKKKAVIKSSKLVGQAKRQHYTDADRKRDADRNKRIAKLMKGFTDYDQDIRDRVATRDIEKAESMPEWIGGGVYDPRWDDVYLDLDPENPTPEPSPTAEERAERRAIEIKAGQDACDLLNRYYRLGKYASHR